MTPIFGPGWGNYAIQGIVEIQIPAPTSFYPATPGWLLLAICVTLWIAAQVARRWQRHKNNQYRRDAKAALTDLSERLAKGDRHALRLLAPLLKRTLLEARGRSALSNLDEADLASQFQQWAPSAAPLPFNQIHRFAYAPLPERVPDDYRELISGIESWIKQHEVPHA